MLNFGNKEFRNLQEQVLKNQEDILTLKQEGMGHEPIPGPEGPEGQKGSQGEQGPRGTGVYGVTAELPSPSGYKEGDIYFKRGVYITPENLSVQTIEIYKNIKGRWVLQTSLRGPQGEPGEGGTSVIANPEGTSTDVISTIDIAGVIYDIGGIDPEYKAYIDLLKEHLEIDSVTGKATFSNDVEVDGKLQVNEYSDFIDAEGHVIGMSAEEKNRLAKTLVIPTPTITATELVGIDTTKSQARIAIGDGLSLENGTLKASGGSAPTNMVTTDTAQTITGMKTFSNAGLTIGNTERSKWKLSAADYLFSITKPNNTIHIRTDYEQMYPGIDNYLSLGIFTANQKFRYKNLYLSGKISDGTNEATVAQLVNAGGTTLYLHKIVLNDSESPYSHSLSIISTDSTPYSSLSEIDVSHRDSIAGISGMLFGNAFVNGTIASSEISWGIGANNASYNFGLFTFVSDTVTEL